MIGRVNLWLGCGVMLAAGFWASSASAQVAFGPGGYGLGFFNYGYEAPRIPYYALYPPVYYSYPVARPYGYSPFAYPPGVLTPEIAPRTSAVIYRNPFVGSKKAAAPPSDDKTTSRARMYYNPYVAPADTASLAKHDQP